MLKYKQITNTSWFTKILELYIYERNAPHMAYEGIPHICICGTITWGERVSGMWGPPSLSPCDCATWGKYEGNPHMPYEVHFSLSLYIYIITNVRERKPWDLSHVWCGKNGD